MVRDAMPPRYRAFNCDVYIFDRGTPLELWCAFPRSHCVALYALQWLRAWVACFVTTMEASKPFGLRSVALVDVVKLSKVAMLRCSVGDWCEHGPHLGITVRISCRRPAY